MIETVNRFFGILRLLATNWYVLGLLGWTLVGLKYPFEQILPRYAG